MGGCPVWARSGLTSLRPTDLFEGVDKADEYDRFIDTLHKVQRNMQRQLEDGPAAANAQQTERSEPTALDTGASACVASDCNAFRRIQNGQSVLNLALHPNSSERYCDPAQIELQLKDLAKSRVANRAS